MKLSTKLTLSSLFALVAVGLVMLITSSMGRNVASSSEQAKLDHLTLSIPDLSKILIAVTTTEGAPTNICKFTQDQLMMMGQMIRGPLGERYTKDRDTKLPGDCASDCTCSYYLGLFESIEAEGGQLSAEQKSMQDSYWKQAETQDANSMKCLEGAKWVCESVVIKNLLGE